MEYRPSDNSPFFYRFNFDGASAKYSGSLNRLPGNVASGTLHLNSFVAGGGYRFKHKHMGYYFLIQPGLSANSLDRVTGTNETGYSVRQFKISEFEVKYSTGVEYYLAEHFALVFEPAYYQNSWGRRNAISSINQLSFNIGFTTTLF